MRYAKWKLSWSGEPLEGYGPDPEIVNRGGFIHGLFFADGGAPDQWLYGHINPDLDLAGLEEWQVVDVTQAEILEKAQEINPECYIDENGTLIFPKVAPL